VAAERAWRELLPLGLRLLLFAEAKKVTGHFSSGKIPDTLQDMQPLALVALSDELRPEAGPVLEALAAQGLTFKILSGDNPETVRATVAHLQLPLAHVPVISGDQLNSGEQREPLLLGGNVFGRVTPQQKLEIVETLQRQGRRVAMIGDGINDILPIKRADLGIAMGEGSPATRTVAGLVLETNNFDLLPQTLDEGRTILRNLRRAAKLFLLKNVYTLILIVAALGIFHLPFPYLPQQVTLLNFLTIGIPAFFIMFGRHPTGQPIRTGFLREVGWFAISSGLAIGGAGLLVFWLAARWFPDDEARQRTLLLSTLVLLGLGNVLRLLADREGQPASADRWLYGWVALALPLYLGVMYLAPLAYFFELSPLTPNQWGLVLAVALPTFLITLVRWFRWKSMTSGK
jgi:cation-transporting ATPase E